VLGVLSLVQTPEVISAINPWHAFNFFMISPVKAFLALGSVVLAVTGAEALYADMGHFGRKPIGLSWLWFVLPGLTLNYMGQGALLMRDGLPALESPFYNLAPDWFRLPLGRHRHPRGDHCVAGGDFRRLLGHPAGDPAGLHAAPAHCPHQCVDRWPDLHSADQLGLMVAVILLVLRFETSSNLTAAYGIAVTGAMFIDNVLLTVVLFKLWKWSRWISLPLLGAFYLVDGAYLAANLTKIPYGGWVPLAIGLVIFTLLTTWSKGRALMMARLRESAMPIPVFVASAANSAVRVPGTAVFMTSTPDGVPHALLHNLKHNKVLHERVILLTVKMPTCPWSSPPVVSRSTTLAVASFAWC
jgi:KUP system potassium uptake protein